MTKGSAADLYKDYWVGVKGEREKRAYYDRLYARIRPKIEIQDAWKILDVAGGNGQFLRYLGRTRGDVLDVSRSGLEEAAKYGFTPIYGDIEKRFPIEPESYDAVLLFEVLEHLHRPNKTLSEVHHILKPGGTLYVGQPNMRPDGVYHVRRYYLDPLLNDLEKTGFRVDWIDYVPAYSMRDSILSDIRHNPSWIRKLIQCVNLGLSFLPLSIRYVMARKIPNRFALLFVIKLTKI